VMRTPPWWLVPVALAAGCGSSSQPTCKRPATTTYSCDPISDPAMGCLGGPVWSPIRRGEADAPIRQDDPGTIYPVGCRATIPDCNPEYQTAPRTFQCDPGPINVWSELG
jgi:hypothetical protein